MKSNKGFSLIEVIIVLALTGIVASFSVGFSFNTLSKNSVTQERDLFISLLLRYSRTAALANTNNVAHGIYIDNANHQYILFNGTKFIPDSAENRTIPYSNDSLTIFSSGGATIVFEQLSGNVIQGAGTINIKNGAATGTLTIRENGQLDW